MYRPPKYIQPPQSESTNVDVFSRDIVPLLLSADASPNVTDKIGATPLHLATFNGHSRVVAMLLAHNNPPVNIDQLVRQNVLQRGALKRVSGVLVVEQSPKIQNFV